MNLRHWIPSTQQMSNAIQLRSEPFGQITMRQAFGMILVAGVLGGILPFLVSWIQAATLDTVLPLAQAVRDLEQIANITGLGMTWPAPINLQVLTESVQTLAGLPQPLPGWMAALLSALGAWISLPLGWMQLWLAYGVLVALSAKSLGATMTLQRFFAATGYFVVPLVLTNLTVIPFIGGLIGGVIGLWAAVVYAKGVQVIGRLDGLRVIASLLLPIIVVVIAYVLFFFSTGLMAGILLG